VSRIEKALEKAVQMRETAEKTADAEIISPYQHVSLPKFEVGESIINPASVDRHIVSITDPSSSASEQYKKLRARILKTTAKDFLNTIMVTSSDIGEGKTITAINLAVSMANEIDYTVLLVDSDLKHPSISKYLGIESRYGLSDYLAGKAELSDILIKTGVGKLVLLPAGNPSENAAELLSSERMRNLVKEMKNRYRDRYIIFDSPPILMASDALTLSGYMDGILLVIQAAHTVPKTASRAISLIKGCNILGIVFNNVPGHYMNYYGNGKYYQAYKNRNGD
jgi:exopolysaccharide/PEP-CTERM locus tyrosine autokinase